MSVKQMGWRKVPIRDRRGLLNTSTTIDIMSRQRVSAGAA